MLLNINHIAVSRNLSWLHKLDGLKDRPTMVRMAVVLVFKPANKTRNQLTGHKQIRTHIACNRMSIMCMERSKLSILRLPGICIV